MTDPTAPGPTPPAPLSLCVYCGSRKGDDPAFEAAARAVGSAIAERGWRLVYGGGRTGLMGSVADAALAGGGEVIGVIPRALVGRELGHAGLTELIVVDTMHERKRLMAERSDAFVALPGGIGTFEELFEVWTWLQLGYHDKPVGAAQRRGLLRRAARLSRPERRPRLRAARLNASCCRWNPMRCWIGSPPSAAVASGRRLPRRLSGEIRGDVDPPGLRPRLRRSRRCGCAPPARPP